MSKYVGFHMDIYSKNVSKENSKKKKAVLLVRYELVNECQGLLPGSEIILLYHKPHSSS